MCIESDKNKGLKFILNKLKNVRFIGKETEVSVTRNILYLKEERNLGFFWLGAGTQINQAVREKIENLI